MRNLILIAVLILGARPAYAQVGGDFAMVGAQWQLTLDVIKTKAQTLLLQNKALVAQREDLQAQIVQTQGAIAQQQEANDGLRQLLKERNGKTDQQIALEGVMAQLKLKKSEAASSEGELNGWKKKLADVERKINLQKLKIAEAQLRQDQQEIQANLKQAVTEIAPPTDPAQLNDLRKQIEEAKAQEILLENQLAELKDAKQKDALGAGSLEGEITGLANRLEVLRKQKAQQENDVLAFNKSSVLMKERYGKLREEKALLEEKIRLYEAQADTLKRALLDSNRPWPEQKKKMIHEMVQADARNSQLRSKINDLREDIGILRERVSKSEQRINIIQGKGNKSNK